MSIFKFKKRIDKDNWNTIQTFLSRIFAFSIGLLFKIVLARYLSVEENGVFGKWLASFNYGIIAFSLGLNLSMIYYSKKNVTISYNFFSNSIVYAIILLACFVIGIFLPEKLYNYTLFITVFLGLVLSSLNSVQLILGKITVFNLSEVTKNILIFLVCLSPILFTEFIDINILYVLYPIALGLTFLIFLYQVDFSNIEIKKITFPKIDYIKYGFKGTILNVLSQSVYIVDIFIVSYIAGAYYLGLYVVAGSIARLLWFFVDAAGTVIFPKLVLTKDSSDSKNIIYKLSSFSFLISSFGLIIFYLFGEFFISLTFGKDYIEGFATIIILMIASPGMIFYKLINRYLASKNEWNISYISIAIALIVNIALNFLLVSRFNILGSAIASLVSYWLCGYIIAKMSGFQFGKLIFSIRYNR